jgi:hypothetical protein
MVTAESKPERLRVSSREIPPPLLPETLELGKISKPPRIKSEFSSARTKIQEDRDLGLNTDSIRKPLQRDEVLDLVSEAERKLDTDPQEAVRLLGKDAKGFLKLVEGLQTADKRNIANMYMQAQLDSYEMTQDFNTMIDLHKVGLSLYESGDEKLKALGGIALSTYFFHEGDIQLQDSQRASASLSKSIEFSDEVVQSGFSSDDDRLAAKNNRAIAYEWLAKTAEGDMKKEYERMAVSGFISAVEEHASEVDALTLTNAANTLSDAKSALAEDEYHSYNLEGRLYDLHKESRGYLQGAGQRIESEPTTNIIGNYYYETVRKFEIEDNPRESPEMAHNPGLIARLARLFKRRPAGETGKNPPSEGEKLSVGEGDSEKISTPPIESSKSADVSAKQESADDPQTVLVEKTADKIDSFKQKTDTLKGRNQENPISLEDASRCLAEYNLLCGEILADKKDRYDEGARKLRYAAGDLSRVYAQFDSYVADRLSLISSSRFPQPLEDTDCKSDFADRYREITGEINEIYDDDAKVQKIRQFFSNLEGRTNKDLPSTPEEAQKLEKPKSVDELMVLRMYRYALWRTEKEALREAINKRLWNFEDS